MVGSLALPSIPGSVRGNRVNTYLLKKGKRSMSVMRQTGLVWCAAMAVGAGMWTNGFAFNSHEYIHLVNHRDSQGNLVVPRAKKPAVKKPPLVKKTVIPAQPKNYTFRNTQWGMSIPQVKTNETAKFSWELQAPILTAGDSRLGYRANVEGLEAFLSYSFTNDRLMTAKYLFDSNHEDELLYLEDYQIVKNWIVQTYGPPQSEEQLWLDDLYHYSEELWGRAVVRGHLTMVAEWDVNGTSIILLLNGGDDSVGLMADFTSKDAPSPTQMVVLPSEHVEEL